MAAIEAMSSGCPVFLSDIPGLRERVKDGEDGFLFSVGEMVSLDKALDRFFTLSEDVRQRITELARIKTEKNYSKEKHIDKLLEIYA